LEAHEAVGNEAFPPLPDRVSVAAQFGSDVLVGRVVHGSGTQDNAAPKDKRLRSRAGAKEGLELEAKLGSQFDR
jgi:hypothetical protein